MKKILSSFICMILVIVASGCSAGAKKPLTKTNPGVVSTRPLVVGYYVNDLGYFDSLPSLKAHADLLNEIHPLWYHVSPDGSLKKEVNLEAIALARQNGIKIIPLVNLVPSQDAILLNQVAQDKTIANLVNEVKTNNYDGIDIDFEFFPVSEIKDFTVDRDKLTLFMKNVHTQMSNMGKVTYMAVLPHVGSSPEVGGVFNYENLAPYLDKVTIMCYDYKESHSPPGPIAPFDWVEKNINTAIKQGFRSEQISLGVATYGYDWPVGKTGGFSKPSSEIMKQITMKGYNVKWSDKYQEPYYTYTDSGGVSREVWFENARTLQTKIDLVKKYKLAGISIWRLGYEDQKFWDIIVGSWGKK
jgi:spore germination protein